jgi:hypothetical protein
MKNKSKHYYDTERNKDPFNLEPLIAKRKEIDAEIEKNHPDIKAMQDIDAAISDIIDKEETKKEKQVYEVEVETVTKVMKQFHGSDLPLYFQWLGGTKVWLYKVYVADGMLKADKIVYQPDGNGELEYTSVQPTCAFKDDHIPIDECIWQEALSLMYNKINKDYK